MRKVTAFEVIGLPDAHGGEFCCVKVGCGRFSSLRRQQLIVKTEFEVTQPSKRFRGMPVFICLFDSPRNS